MIWHIVYVAVTNMAAVIYWIYIILMQSRLDGWYYSGLPTVFWFAMAVMAFLVSLGLTVVLLIQYHKAAYDLYRSSVPQRSMLYLMLGIFLLYPTPFFFYACRNRDDGMPVKEPELLPEGETV